MFDPIAEGLRAAAMHHAWAAPAVFAAGACSSFGPCAAPRLIAAATVAGAEDRRKNAVNMFSLAAGLIGAYAAFGATASLLSRVLQFSSVTYALLATGLACAGIVTLFRNRSHCAHSDAFRVNAGAGGSFFLGASFAFVVSPCCTPLAAGILAYASASADPVYGAAMLACFAIGHALPVVGVGAAAGKIAERLSRLHLASAVSTVSGTLMLALAAYYAVLA